MSCKKNRNEDLNNLDCSKISSGYSANIKPIIDGNCLSSGCHNTGSVNGDFTTYSGLKAKADNGTLDNRVIQNKSMPPSGSLSMDNLKKIKCWLNSGSPNN
jgi:hypothetical protein